jgi:hypothetical protein
MNAPKKQRPIQDHINENGVHVFTGNKEDWTITAEKAETSVILVGDSNLKKIRLVPDSWQINALPGAHLSHVRNVISKLTGRNKQFTIIIQAGINHRYSHDTAAEDDIRSMLFDVRRNPAVDDVFFNGVSIPAGMCAAEADRLNNLNRFMETELGSDHYIAPLNQIDVRTEPTDRYGIHYDQDTIDHIALDLTRTFTGSDF